MNNVLKHYHYKHDEQCVKHYHYKHDELCVKILSL
jgi:hypothetical protein